MKQNHLQLPPARNLAGFHGLGLGLTLNYTFLQEGKIACIRRLGLGLAFDQPFGHFRCDSERNLVGNSIKIIYSSLQNEKIFCFHGLRLGPAFNRLQLLPEQKNSAIHYNK